MSELGVFAFCAATGFVSAATISSFYHWVTSQPADFSIERKSMLGIVTAILLSMFAGPYIVIQRVYAGVRAHEMRAFTVVAAVLVATIWSVCAGIFYLSLLVSA